MGEAIISRGFSGSSGSSNGSTNNKFRTEIITSTTLWRIPDDATGSVSVRIFGGGGAGMNRRGGGGGMMNNTIIDSNELKGTDVYINIGAGGKLLQSSSFGEYSMCGGSSSFGEYISALGGNSFSGGSGGGSPTNNRGGNGFQFGGGGGGLNDGGGYGGKWGGGGGTSWKTGGYACGGCLYENSSNSKQITGYSGLAGNSGNQNVTANDGINTIGMGLDFEGSGKSGFLCNNTDFKTTCAGGGYGGRGGISYTNGNPDTIYIIGGGGGGYGADGGNAGRYGGGGGGGYGGRGGDGSNNNEYGGGGGGGYGKHGYGGGWDNNNNCIVPAGIAAGGFGPNSTESRNLCGGGGGICIIQYYVK